MEKRAFMQPQKALLSETGFAAESLLAPAQALAVYFARVLFEAPAVEEVARDAARGRVLASEIRTDADYPLAPRSNMDGYAILAASVPGTLQIAGDVRMGQATACGIDGTQAARIPTGGVLPPGADAVVPIEEARAGDGTVSIEGRAERGQNVIPRGADMRAGDVVLSAGRTLHAAHIGLLASLGIERVPVYRTPLVGIVSSGDEIVPVSQRPRAGEVRDSNRYAIAASLQAMGLRTKHYPTVGDAPGELADALRLMAAECDAIVASGGSSVGAHDRLPEAVAQFEPGVVVHGLRIKPGKPALFGAAGSTPIVGLPGNPASASIVLEAVAASIFLKLTGANHRQSVERLPLTAALRGRPGWTWYVPVAIEDARARPLELRSFSVRLAAQADGYVVVHPDAPAIDAGDEVVVHRFWGT
jgi:molybdopterin molybdotransferase